MVLRASVPVFLLLLGLSINLLPAKCAEDAPAADSKDQATDEAADGEEGQDKGILSELTITLGSEVLDERSFVIRSSDAGSKKTVVRLGNVSPIEAGVADYEEKVEKAKKALKQFAESQMIFWKKAPEEAQTTDEVNGMPVMVADVWTIDGRHVPKAMIKAGHLGEKSEYESEIAKDILMAESDEQKRDSYKKLEEALKENNEAQKKAAEEAGQAEEDEEPAEPLGFAGWVGLSVPVVIVLGVFFNFGREDPRRSKGSQKKKGLFSSILAKLNPRVRYFA